MDHFAFMGDLGVNARHSIQMELHLTDALYGVRYYMNVKDLDPYEKEAHPR